MRKKVGLIFGGRSLEREISIITAMQVLNALVGTSYIVEPIYMFEGEFYFKNLSEISDFVDFDCKNHIKTYLKNGAFYQKKRFKEKCVFKPDVVLNCCHGSEGENGILQAILDFNGIKYTSPKVLQSGICMDKAVSKRLFEAYGFDVLPCEVVCKNDFELHIEDIAAKIDALGYPLIVKPSSMGSSIGVSAVNDRNSLENALQLAFEFDDKVVVEKKLVNCVEVNCAAMRLNGNIVLSETENPTSNGEYLSFDDKYLGGKMSAGEHIIPAGIGDLNDVVKSNTRRLYELIDLDGIVRVDYLCDMPQKRVYVNEINTIPGSMAFYLFKDVSFKQLMINLLDETLKCPTRKFYNDAFTGGVLKEYSEGPKSKNVGLKMKK